MSEDIFSVDETEEDYNISDIYNLLKSTQELRVTIFEEDVAVFKEKLKHHKYDSETRKGLPSTGKLVFSILEGKDLPAGFIKLQILLKDKDFRISKVEVPQDDL